jgi:ACR3 family arsenite transporter
MYAIALLFFRVFYVDVIPEAGLRDSYIAGCILLAGAPCTAMVFVWSLLVGGDGGYTLVQVAFNDLLLLVLYVPTAGLLLGVSNISLPWDVIALSVTLFIVAPLALAAALRTLILRTRGEAFLRDRVVEPFKPVTMAALLGTLVLVFIFQGRTIGEKPLPIVLLVVPIMLQTVIIFGITYAAGYFSCMDHKRLAPAAMIATSNFFELAVAVAISLYGLDSGAALATVVGVLVEVPVMLLLVRLCMWMKPALERRAARCDEVCPWAKTAGAQLAAGCAGRTRCCGSGETSAASAGPGARASQSFAIVDAEEDPLVAAKSPAPVSALRGSSTAVV